MPVVVPADRVGGGGFQQDAKPRAFPHHFVTGAWVEVKPQGDPAGWGVPADPGPADAAQALFEVLKVFREQPCASLNDRIQRRQQLSGGDLVERAWARAHGGGAS